MDAVATPLTAEYGRGFGRRNLYYMMLFAEVFPDTEIVHALRAQLSLRRGSSDSPMTSSTGCSWTNSKPPCAHSAAQDVSPE